MLGRLLFPPDRYELLDGTLCRKARGQRELVEAATIRTWWVERDCTTDVVHLELNDGRILHWPDVDFQLLPLLDEAGAVRRCLEHDVAGPADVPLSALER